MSLFHRFARAERGNVAMMFALAMIPVIGAVGAAVDYSRVAQVQARLTDSLDAAVLALGTQPEMSNEDAFATVEDWLNLHMGEKYAGYWTLDDVNQDKKGVISATASGSVDTTIVNVLGIDKVAIGATAEIVRNIGKVELALVLDNTGSMKGTKLTKLKDAATKLVDALAASTKNKDDLRIGLVPFSQTVRVGSAYADADWIDADGESESAKTLFLGQEVNRFDLFDKLDADWSGCVETRAGEYEATEDFDAGNPDSLYVPYFAPDEPGIKGAKGAGLYANSYLADSDLPVIEAALTLLGLGELFDSLPEFMLLQGDLTKYVGAPQTGTSNGSLGYQFGPNSGCETQPLMRLTSNSDGVKTAIGNMIAAGNTDVPIGLTWGWNVISPIGPFADGKPYKDEEWQKFVVLMTDGNNENQVGNLEDLSFYSGVGYVWQGRMGVPPDNTKKSERTKARDERLGEICKAMTDKGIILYTIRVEVNNSSSPVLEDCAVAPGKFYEVDSASQLNAVFADIGASIQKLRLSR
jgi:Flp pilus assembly protein TadG